jgi:hypothetical protein
MQIQIEFENMNFRISFPSCKQFLYAGFYSLETSHQHNCNRHFFIRKCNINWKEKSKKWSLSACLDLWRLCIIFTFIGVDLTRCYSQSNWRSFKHVFYFCRGIVYSLEMKFWNSYFRIQFVFACTVINQFSILTMSNHIVITGNIKCMSSFRHICFRNVFHSWMKYGSFCPWPYVFVSFPF